MHFLDKELDLFSLQTSDALEMKAVYLTVQLSPSTTVPIAMMLAFDVYIDSVLMEPSG